jgi:hypothetical protein
VWLHQLSREHGRDIHRLDQIPDGELDTLARRGFNALWLIGVWERSRASQRVKQLTGNPEAVASAYSLADYNVAEDLGGEGAYMNLRDRAAQRGIRLASDMVPNHMGIDSRWVIQHPDWFLALPYTPFPSYSFNGPDLSSDGRVEIKIEDHYFDRSDAAVVFRRIDRWTGDARYIYHGNDGTSFPWNDTAQLNYAGQAALPAAVVPDAGNWRGHTVAVRARYEQGRFRSRHADRVLARGGGSRRHRGPGHAAARGGVLADGGLFRPDFGHASRVQLGVHEHAA